MSIIVIILVKEHVHIFIELSSTSLVLLLEKTSNQNVTSDKNDALIGQFGTYGYEKRSWKFFSRDAISHCFLLMCSSRAYLISETCPRQDWIPGSIRALYCISQGRIQDLKLGGGGALKNIAPSGGRREHFWVISCEKSRFYAKKKYFF